MNTYTEVKTKTRLPKVGGQYAIITDTIEGKFHWSVEDQTWTGPDGQKHEATWPNYWLEIQEASQPKTKPYGVRFNPELIDAMTKKLSIKTPQRILNYLSDEWLAANKETTPVGVDAKPKKYERGNVKITKTTPQAFDGPKKPYTDGSDEFPKVWKAKEENSTINFGTDTILQIEKYTEYKAKDRPASGSARSEWDAKKKKADAIIRAEWTKYKSAK